MSPMLGGVPFWSGFFDTPVLYTPQSYPVGPQGGEVAQSSPPFALMCSWQPNFEQGWDRAQVIQSVKRTIVRHRLYFAADPGAKAVLRNPPIVWADDKFVIDGRTLLAVSPGMPAGGELVLWVVDCQEITG